MLSLTGYDLKNLKRKLYSLPASLIRFFIYSNLFIAVCAVLMADQTFHFLLNISTHFHLASFIFFSTLSSYSFHWWLTADSVIPSQRIEWLQRNRSVHLIIFIIGMAGSAIFFFYLLAYWPWLLIAAIVTFLYSAPKIPHTYFRALRKVALGKTIFLAFVWMYVTTILPIIVSEQIWTLPFTFFVLSRFFLIYAVCILFDYRDRQDDKVAGIRSLITYLSEKGITHLFVFSLLLFGIATLLLSQFHFSWSSIALLLVPGIITAGLYNYALRHFADMFYYFVLDGLMALSALLMLVTRI